MFVTGSVHIYLCPTQVKICMCVSGKASTVLMYCSPPSVQCVVNSYIILLQILPSSIIGGLSTVESGVLHIFLLKLKLTLT